MVRQHGDGDVVEAAPALLARALPRLAQLSDEAVQLREHNEALMAAQATPTPSPNPRPLARMQGVTTHDR